VEEQEVFSNNLWLGVLAWRLFLEKIASICNCVHPITRFPSMTPPLISCAKSAVWLT
jgi:hypothetical protein